MRTSNSTSTSNLVEEDAQNRPGYSDSPTGPRTSPWPSGRTGSPGMAPHGLLGTHPLDAITPPPLEMPPSCEGLCVEWNSGGLEEEGVVLSPLCFLQPGGFNHVSAIGVFHLPSPSGSPSGSPIQAALLRSTTMPLTETLPGLLEAGRWLWQKGTGLPTGIQLQYASDFHLSRNPNNQETHMTSLANFQLVCDTDDKNSSRMPMLFN